MEGPYVYLWPIHIDVWQKPPQYCNCPPVKITKLKKENRLVNKDNLSSLKKKEGLQYHNLKASILQRSAFFMVQLSRPYMTTGKTIALTRWTFVGKVMSLVFNMLSRFAIVFFQGAGVF